MESVRPTADARGVRLERTILDQRIECPFLLFLYPKFWTPAELAPSYCARTSHLLQLAVVRQIKAQRCDRDPALL